MKRLIDCREFERNHAAYLDGQVSVDLRQAIRTHLETCRRCRERSRGTNELTASLRAMPVRVPPAQLTTRLRIAASHELARRRENARWFQHRWAGMKLTFENLMRPLALPAAGGIVSAIVLLGLITPYLESRTVAPSGYDVPTALYTEASVYRLGPVGFGGGEVDVELTIDENGKMIDYEATDPHCRNLLKDPEIRRSLENHLLLTEFTPATAFGQKTVAKIRLTLKTTRIDVKG